MYMHSPRILTIAVVHDESRVLLGFKKRGFGMGRWNGFGGKVEAGESVSDAAMRELREESGLEAKHFEKRGTIIFEYASDPVPLEVHVFSVTSWRGELVESDEMRPAWFRHTEIPYASMWADDKYWLPLLLRGRGFEGRFRFLDYDHLLHHEVRELSLANA